MLANANGYYIHTDTFVNQDAGEAAFIITDDSNDSDDGPPPLLVASSSSSEAGSCRTRPRSVQSMSSEQSSN
eukprot:2517211-Rhodomonas_salina.1